MTDQALETILYEQQDAVAIITLNRPEALNALSVQLRNDLSEALRRAEADDSVRAIVLTGSGDRAFCVGLDLKEISADPSKLGPATGSKPTDSPAKALEGCSCPVIAAVNGFAITGGFELAMACDVLVASENASFGDTHAAVGVMPGWGLSQRLSRIIGPSRAKEMHFGCQRIDAHTASAWGLVNRVVPLAELRAHAIELAHSFAKHDPVVIREMKRVIDEGYETSFAEGMEIEGATARAWNQKAKPVDVSKKG